jgi:hypothetical protein
MSTIETQLEFDFMKPNQLTLNFDQNHKFTYDASALTSNFLVNSSLKLHNPQGYSVIFYKGAKRVGTLSWEDGPMKFEGDVEESAQLFFDNVIKVYTQAQFDLMNYNR